MKEEKENEVARLVLNHFFNGFYHFKGVDHFDKKKEN